MRYDRLLENKTALILGGAGEIGRETAMLFASAGAAVGVADIDAEAGAYVTDLMRCCGGVCRFYPCDVRDAASFSVTLDTFAEEFGIPDVLVLSAGVCIPEPVDSFGEDSADRQYDVNYMSAFRAARRFLPAMKKRGSGSILLVNSDYAVSGTVGHAVYGGAAAACHALMELLARDAAPFGVRVNEVLAGMAMGRAALDLMDRIGEKEARNRWRISQVLPVRGHAACAAYALLYLASGMATPVSGESIYVDGGQTVIAHSMNRYPLLLIPGALPVTGYDQPRPVVKTARAAEGRTAVVTRGTTPTGRAVVRRLAEHGARVYFGAENAEAEREFAALIADTAPGSAALPCDVSDMDSVMFFCEKAAALAGGKIDILVNETAHGDSRPFLDIPEEEETAAFNRDQYPVLETRRRLTPMLRQSGHGAMVDILACLGKGWIGGFGLQGRICSSLAAGMRISAIEGGIYNLRANAVVAGDTGAEAVADAVLFLATDMSAYTTGSVLTLGGAVAEREA